MDRRHIGASHVAGFALCLLFHASSVSAQVVHACDAATQLDQIATPEAANIRHFANGAVMVAIVDDGRADVAKALSVLILSPPLNNHGERQCRLMTATQNDGYAALLLDQAAADYDASRGLRVVVPGIAMTSSDSTGALVDLSVTINQATGDITAEVIK